MAWVRLDDRVMGHPKLSQFIDYSDPFCLWIWGLCYSQQYLTDGKISVNVLPNRRAKSAADRLVEAGLWIASEDGYQVHDYLVWQDSRELVLSRKAKSKQRLEAWRERKQQARIDEAETRVKRRSQRVANAFETLPITKPNQTKEIQIQEQRQQESKEHSPVGRRHASSDPRIKAFLEWFQVEYPRLRNGASYMVIWGKHSKLVKDMLATVDLDRLKKLAQIMLNERTDEPFIVESGRGISVLYAKFDWLSDRLAAWEARQKVSA